MDEKKLLAGLAYTIVYCNTWETPSIQYNNFLANFIHEASHRSKTLSASTTPQFNWKTKKTPHNKIHSKRIKQKKIKSQWPAGLLSILIFH